MTNKTKTAPKGVKRAKKGAKHAISLSGVASFCLFLPVLRRLERTYLFKRVSSTMLVIIANEGIVGPTRACKLLYGYKDGTSYRSTTYSLRRLLDAGLAVSIGGKWQVSEKGMRELGLID